MLCCCILLTTLSPGRLFQCSALSGRPTDPVSWSMTSAAHKPQPFCITFSIIIADVSVSSSVIAGSICSLLWLPAVLASPAVSQDAFLTRLQLECFVFSWWPFLRNFVDWLALGNLIQRLISHVGVLEQIKLVLSYWVNVHLEPNGECIYLSCIKPNGRLSVVWCFVHLSAHVCAFFVQVLSTSFGDISPCILALCWSNYSRYLRHVIPPSWSMNRLSIFLGILS